MRLTSKWNRSRHTKADADEEDGWEDARQGGKFWTGWEGSAALGRSRDGRVRMRVEKKKTKVWRRELGWAGWLDSPKNARRLFTCAGGPWSERLLGKRLEQGYGRT